MNVLGKGVVTACVCCLSCFAAPSGYGHFSIATKLEVRPVVVTQPDRALISLDGARVTRGEFAAYLQRLVALDTKNDRTQPAFYAALTLWRRVALTQPIGADAYLRSRDELPPATRPDVTAAWFRIQAQLIADVFAGQSPEWLDAMGDSKPLADLLNYYRAARRLDYLEQFVVSSDVEAVPAAIAAAIARRVKAGEPVVDANWLREIDDTLSTPEEQMRMRKRWRTFSRAVVTATPSKKHCDQIDYDALGQPLTLATINAHVLDVATYPALFGNVRDPSHWRSTATLNCSRYVRSLALSDWAALSGIEPPDLERDVLGARLVVLLATALAQQVSPAPSPAGDVALATSVLRAPELESWFAAWNEERGTRSAASVDTRFIQSVNWVLERIDAPLHSIHM